MIVLYKQTFFHVFTNKSNEKFLFQELQRRLDQTLGKPGSYLAGIDRSGNVKPMTIGARLYRLEQQVNKILVYVQFRFLVFYFN